LWASRAKNERSSFYCSNINHEVEVKRSADTMYGGNGDECQDPSILSIQVKPLLATMRKVGKKTRIVIAMA